MQTLVFLLNAVVPGIPLLQFVVMRRPPRGGRALWERLLEGVARAMGLSAAFGRRASVQGQQRKVSRVGSLRADVVAAA